jgi:hypothetical protein
LRLFRAKTVHDVLRPYTYYYAGAQLIALREITTTANPTGTLYYLPSDHPSASLRASPGQHEPVTCGNSTCGAVGSVVARQWYYPYGAVRASTGTLPTKRTFTGQLADETGLYFYNARYYSPCDERPPVQAIQCVFE